MTKRTLLLAVAASAGCGAPCKLRERPVDIDDATTGTSPRQLLEAVPTSETLLASPTREGFQGSDALALAGPYTVRLVDDDIEEAHLVTHGRRAEQCSPRQTLRVPIRIRVSSADTLLALTSWAYATATDDVLAYEGERDPDAADLAGTHGPVLQEQIDRATAEAAWSIEYGCPGTSVPAELGMFYAGPMDGPRWLEFNVYFSERRCIDSVSVAGRITLTP